MSAEVFPKMGRSLKFLVACPTGESSLGITSCGCGIFPYLRMTFSFVSIFVRSVSESLSA
jgi:hypothetical protein